MSSVSWNSLLRLSILFALLICAINQECPPPCASPDGGASCSPAPNMCQEYIGDGYYYQYIPCSLQTCYLWELFSQYGCDYQPIYNNLSCISSPEYCNYTLAVSGYTNDWVMAPCGIESLNDYTPDSYGLSIIICVAIAAVILLFVSWLYAEHMKDYFGNPSGILGGFILGRVQDDDRRNQITKVLKILFTINMMASFLQLLYTIIYLHSLLRDQVSCGEVGISQGGSCYNSNMTLVPSTMPNCIVVTSGMNFWFIGVLENGWAVLFICCFALASINHITHTIQSNGQNKLMNYFLYCVTQSTNQLNSLWTATNWDTCLAFNDDNLTSLQLTIFNINIYCLIVIIICAIFAAACKDNNGGNAMRVIVFLGALVMGGCGLIYRVVTYIDIAERYFPKILFFHDILYHLYTILFS